MSSSLKDADSAYSDSKVEERGPKLDKHGLPLIPQPSEDPSDPLNWPQWLKIAILIQVSTLALLGPLNQGVVNPAYVPLAAHFHVTVLVASYQTVIAIAFAGIGSFIWVPLANTYGRRPIILFTTLIAAASSLGSGKATTWSQLLASRVFNGIGTSSFFTLGAATVVDTFFLHERGRAMGVFTVALTNSAHIASIPGGFLAQFVGYQWCYYLPAILDIALFGIMLLCLPETLYVRGSKPLQTQYPILRRMGIWNLRPEDKHLSWKDFWRPFEMFKYLAIIFPALYYSFTFAISSILPAVTSANLFARLYNFDASQTGLALGLGTLIGSTLGELLGGSVIDRTMRLSRKRDPSLTNDPIPEVRLRGIWVGTVLVPVGVLIWGITIHFKTNFLGLVFGFGIACFGIQIISTVLYSYCSDCYKPQTPHTAQVFNFGRQTVGMTVGFWAIPFGDRIGYHLMGLTLALISLVFFLPILWLMKDGRRVRRWQGVPKFQEDL